MSELQTLHARRCIADGHCSQQEDTFKAVALSLPAEELSHSVQRQHEINWDPVAFGLPVELATQLLFVGVYDGCATLAMIPHIIH